jgi:hypothetical protein
MRLKPLTLSSIILLISLFTTPATARRFILNASPSDVVNVANDYELKVVKQIPNRSVFLVTAADSADPNELINRLSADPRVGGFELDGFIKAPEASPTISLNQSTGAILDGMASMTAVSYYGTDAPSSYITQQATTLTRVAETQAAFGLAGSGIVAIIDTGIDPNHPVLEGVLVPGYDFVRDVPGTPSELSDLDQSTAAILDQSTGAILDKNTVVTVNQSTAAILDQSTAAILDTSKLPPAFGHGTMVAGLVHLVAPNAKIMALKAAQANGNAYLFDVIRAIYYAADNNAKIINMSLSASYRSKELTAAVNYVNSTGVICVASVGNSGANVQRWPASFDNVLGIGSTSNTDQQSSFTNYGSVADLAAPGEGVVTTYPGKNYAAAWGTSFSSPLVSGTISLFVEIRGKVSSQGAAKFLSNAQYVNSFLGYGRLDIYQAVQAAKQ